MKKYILSTGIIVIALVFFKKSEDCFAERNSKRSFDHSMSKLEIGDKHEGGIVAYLLQAGDEGYDANVPHGLIAAPEDQSKGIQWFNGNYVTTGATGVAIGAGAANTDSIVKHQGDGKYAAKLCADLVIDKYNDWYLPSKNELNQLFINKAKIPGLAGDTYWCSTEDKKIFYSWRQGFFSGSQVSSDKKVLYAVRAIRKF